MYSVVEIQGHQFKVAPGMVIDVERIECNPGEKLEFDRVLLVAGGEKTIVGRPVVAGAKVEAHVIKNDRDRKVLVFKRAPGKWKKRRGHRQEYTSVLITQISSGDGSVEKIDTNSDVAKKYLQ